MAISPRHHEDPDIHELRCVGRMGEEKYAVYSLLDQEPRILPPSVGNITCVLKFILNLEKSSFLQTDILKIFIKFIGVTLVSKII